MTSKDNLGPGRAEGRWDELKLDITVGKEDAHVAEFFLLIP